MIHIKLKDRYIVYEFDLYDKYTLVKGESASGKTTLHDLFSVYATTPSAIQCSGYNKLRSFPLLVTLDEAELFLNPISDCVFILDEDHPLLTIKGFENILNSSNNYFIIICREKLFKNLSINLRSIVKIVSSGKYHRFEPIYTLQDSVDTFTLILTEDSKTGKQFLSQFFDNVEDAGHILRLSSSSKDNIASALQQCAEDICVVFDSSGIGTTYDDIAKVYKYYKYKITVLTWESFEAYLLSLDRYKEVFKEEYDCRFNSYEQYATTQIQAILSVFPGINYNKSRLPICFKINGCNSCNKNSQCPYFEYDNSSLLTGRVKELAEVSSDSNDLEESHIFNL